MSHQQQFRVFSIRRDITGSAYISESPVWYSQYEDAQDEIREATTQPDEELRVEARVLVCQEEYDEGRHQNDIVNKTPTNRYKHVSYFFIIFLSILIASLNIVRNIIFIFLFT